MMGCSDDGEPRIQMDEAGDTLGCAWCHVGIGEVDGFIASEEAVGDGALGVAGEAVNVAFGGAILGRSRHPKSPPLRKDV